jgi:hypothetical protein
LRAFGGAGYSHAAGEIRRAPVGTVVENVRLFIIMICFLLW